MSDLFKINVQFDKKGDELEKIISYFLISQLEKLGNTPFVSKHINIDMDEDIFIRIGDLNIARRTLSERLIGERLNDYKDPIINEVTFDKINTKEIIDLDSIKELEEL